MDRSITEAGLAWLETHPRAPTEDGVESLIGRVLAADGRLEIPRGIEAEMAHTKLVEMSHHSPSRPKGFRLQLRSVGRWDEERNEIVLVRYLEDDVEESPVPVPTHVARYHPMVKAYLADRHRHAVSKEHLSRAARLLQAIVDEAPRRGLEVLDKTRAKVGADSSVSREIDRGHLILRSPAGIYAIRVVEVSAPNGKRLEPRPWNERSTRPRWLDARTHEFVSTGDLELIVEGPGMAYSGTRYRDAKTIRLEAKLPRLFRAIEVQRRYAEIREEERQREVAERQGRWEAAMTEARRRYDEQARWDHFAQRAREWRETTEQRAFIAAMREAVTDYKGPERSSIVAQLEFVERKLDESDPVQHPALVLADVPDPKPDDLKPFLDGWSPHGP